MSRRVTRRRPASVRLREFAGVFAFVTAAAAAGLGATWIVTTWILMPHAATGAGASLPARIAAAVVLAAGAVLAVWARFVEPRLLSVTRVSVNSERVTSPLRIVFLSDLHAERGWLMRDRLAPAVAAERPDAVVLGGDYLNSRSEEAQRVLRESVGALAGVAPTYAVRGNVDQRRPEAIGQLEGAGISVLSGTHADLGGGVTVWGVEFLDEEMLARCASSRDRSRFNVCVTHEPSLMSRAARAGFDLFLAGHTHGGQVRLPLYGALLTFAMSGKAVEAGRYHTAGMTGYVTRGVGLEGGPMPRARLWCRPEVVVIDLAPRRA